GVVQPLSLRRRHEYPHGAFFVLDFDSFWQGSASRVDEFDPERIAELLGDLHAPVGETFQLAITDRLRDELRKVP
ncbi:MAG: TIGR04255 family protein, partial [Actinobacteria bacterium]|nr:TIGR04255 family protein [Actinomycetota bacterium]